MTDNTRLTDNEPKPISGATAMIIYKNKMASFVDAVDDTNLGKLIFGTIKKSMTTAQYAGSVFVSYKSIFSGFMAENGFLADVLSHGNNSVSDIRDVVKTDLCQMLGKLFTDDKISKAAKDYLKDDANLCNSIYNNAKATGLKDMANATPDAIINGLKSISKRCSDEVEKDVIHSQKTYKEREAIFFDKEMAIFNKIFGCNINTDITKADLTKVGIGANIAMNRDGWKQSDFEYIIRYQNKDKNTEEISKTELNDIIKSFKLGLDIVQVKVNNKDYEDNIEITYTEKGKPTKYKTTVPVKLGADVTSGILH